MYLPLPPPLLVLSKFPVWKTTPQITFAFHPSHLTCMPSSSRPHCPRENNLIIYSNYAPLISLFKYSPQFQATFGESLLRFPSYYHILPVIWQSELYTVLFNQCAIGYTQCNSYSRYVDLWKQLYQMPTSLPYPNVSPFAVSYWLASQGPSLHQCS